MKFVSNKLTGEQLSLIQNLVKIRFSNTRQFSTAESLILYEQNLLPEDEIFQLCEDELGTKLSKPRVTYLPDDVFKLYENCEAVPFKIDNVKEEIHIMCMHEFKRDSFPRYRDYKTIIYLVPLYYYINVRTKYYTVPSWIYILSAKDIFEYITEEAISLGAIDITISSSRNSATVYYNVKKQKVYSKRNISFEDVPRLVEHIAMLSGATFTDLDYEPKYMNTKLNDGYRGRTCISRVIWGFSVTIRVLSNKPLDKTLEDLNLSKGIIDFSRDKSMDLKDLGLRLLVGETMSGKTTTILAMLREFILEDKHKIRTIEMPVETFLDGAEQTSVETEEMYSKYCMALLRENPGICYLSEITNATARNILETANTAKPVFSTLHANSIPGVISRLVDLSGLSIDRVIECLQSVIFQQLEYDEESDSLLPINKAFYFSEQVKKDLFSKTIGEIEMYFMKEDNIEYIY